MFYKRSSREIPCPSASAGLLREGADCAAGCRRSSELDRTGALVFNLPASRTGGLSTCPLKATQPVVFCYSSLSGKKGAFWGIEVFYIIIMAEFLIYIFLKAQQIRYI